MLIVLYVLNCLALSVLSDCQARNGSEIFALWCLNIFRATPSAASPPFSGRGLCVGGCGVLAETLRWDYFLFRRFMIWGFPVKCEDAGWLLEAS